MSDQENSDLKGATMLDIRNIDRHRLEARATFDLLNAGWKVEEIERLDHVWGARREQKEARRTSDCRRERIRQETIAQAQTARKLRADGFTFKQIAQAMGLCLCTVRARLRMHLEDSPTSVPSKS